MRYHVPVLLNESIKGLSIKPNGTYLDLTFGGGGHSRGILKELLPTLFFSVTLALPLASDSASIGADCFFSAVTSLTFTGGSGARPGHPELYLDGEG